MDAATIQSDLALITAVIGLLVQAGEAIAGMIPEITLFFQVINGTPLSAAQQADLNNKHAALTAAALAPLGPAPAGDAA